MLIFIDSLLLIICFLSIQELKQKYDIVLTKNSANYTFKKLFNNENINI